jgi:hypothetical protein
LHNINVSGNLFQYISQYVTGIRKLVSEINPDIILVCDDGLKAFFLPKILGKKIPIIYERHVSKLWKFQKIKVLLKGWLRKGNSN